MNNIKKDFLIPFIVGTSLPCIIVTLSYISRAYFKNPVKQFIHNGRVIQPMLMFLMIPILIGLTNVVLYHFIKSNILNKTITRFVSSKWTPLIKTVLIGALFGHILSLLGTFGMNAPINLFGLPAEQRFLPMKIAPFFYMVIFGILVYNTNRLFRLN